MRYTYSSNFGCLIAVLVMFMMLSVLGFMSRLIFATPLGIVLLITAGVWYIMRSKNIAGETQSSFENPPEEEEQHDYSEQSHEDDRGPQKPLREADDVDFHDIDE